MGQIRGIEVEPQNSGISRMFLETVCYSVSRLEGATVTKIDVLRRAPGYLLAFEGLAGKAQPFTLNVLLHELGEHVNVIDRRIADEIATRLQAALDKGEYVGALAVWPYAPLTPVTRKIAAELLASLGVNLQGRITAALSNLAWDNPRYAGVDNVLHTLTEMDKVLGDARTALIDAYVHWLRKDEDARRAADAGAALVGTAGEGI